MRRSSLFPVLRLDISAALDAQALLVLGQILAPRALINIVSLFMGRDMSTQTLLR